MSLRQPSPAIVVAMVAVYAYLCFTAIMEVPFPNTFDELGHFSYVLHVAESAGWWIDFDDFYMFDVIDYAGFTDEPNYINHPPAYYLLMSALSGASSGSAQQDIVTLRSINAALSTLGVVVAFALARRMQWEANVFYAFGIILILAPPLPIIGAAVNNDNLGLLGGSLCVLGAYRLLAGDRGAGAWVPFMLGLALAVAAKLTSAALCGLFSLFVIGFVAIRDGPRFPGSVWPWAFAGLGLLSALPYLFFAIEFGSPYPNTPGQIAIMEALVEANPTLPERMPPLEFLTHFWSAFAKNWMATPGRNAWERAMIVVPLVSLLLTAYAVIVGGRGLVGGRRHPAEALIFSGGLAMLTMALVHSAYAYRLYLTTGLALGAYPRYYFPLWAIVPAACGHVISTIDGERRRAILAYVLIGANLVYYALGHSWA